MPTPPEFFVQLPGKTNEELYEILGHADDYSPEAIQAVGAELRKRDLPAERAEEKPRKKNANLWVISVILILGGLKMVTRADRANASWGIGLGLLLIFGGFLSFIFALWGGPNDVS